MAAHSLDYNYDFAAVKKWIEAEIQGYRKSGHHIQDFCDDLSGDDDGFFTRGMLQKFRNTKESDRQKVMSEAVLKAFSAYREETLNQTIAWARWERPTDKSNGTGLAKRLRQVEEDVSRLYDLFKSLEAYVTGHQHSGELHPLTAAIHKSLRSSGIDPATEEGRSVIAAAAKDVDEAEAVLGMIYGDADPEYRSIFAIGKVLSNISKDWLTDEIEALVMNSLKSEQKARRSSEKASR
jgi:hypothetical protein